jgi:hypothetical protein
MKKKILHLVSQAFSRFVFMGSEMWTVLTCRYVYKDWTTTHDKAVYHFPYFEKKLPATSYPISETDSAIPITSRMDDLQELVIDVDQTYSDELR